MASKNIIYLSDSDFQESISNSTLPILVDFWAEWCGPCKMIAPELEKLANELEGKVQVAKMNVDENRSTPGQFQVMSIPTLILFKDGKEVERVIGFRKKDELLKMINRHL